MRSVKVVDIANEIVLDLTGGSGYHTHHLLEIPRVANWLRGKVGDLNSYINGDWFVDGDDEIISHGQCNIQPVLNLNSIDFAPFTPEYSWPSGGVTFNNKHYIGIDEKAILKKMYYIYYYDSRARKTLDSLDDNLVLSINQDSQSITLINRNEIAKTYISLKKQEIDELKKLIFGYIRNRNTPRMIEGDDYMSAWNEFSVSFDRSAYQERLYTF